MSRVFTDTNGQVFELTEQQAEQLRPIIKDFVEASSKNREVDINEWMPAKMQEYLKETSVEDIKATTGEICSSLSMAEQKKTELAEARALGRDRDGWFADEIKVATSSMAPEQTVQYCKGLDEAICKANSALMDTMTTQSGVISQNPHLDGFIAEQYHAQTFNANAVAKGSPYRAEVVTHDGTQFTKNGVDIVIKDGSGKVVSRYQAKYCKDAQSTIDAFKDGQYNGQQSLVPSDQQAQIASTGKKCTSTIEYDGVSSNPLSKADAEKMRDEAQSGKWNDLNWNEYSMKDLCKGIGKNAGKAALMGVAVSAASNLWKIAQGEDVDGAQFVEDSLKSGADFGIKAATGGALKVAVEKGIITGLPKALTSASALSSIAFVGIEDAKILKKIADEEMTLAEGADALCDTTVSTTAGLIASGKGAGIGASIGSVLGPIGTAIGGFVGGTVGFIAGSKFGKSVYEGAKKIASGIKNGVLKVKEKAKQAASNIKNFAKKIFG